MELKNLLLVVLVGSVTGCSINAAGDLDVARCARHVFPKPSELPQPGKPYKVSAPQDCLSDKVRLKVIRAALDGSLPVASAAGQTPEQIRSAVSAARPVPAFQAGGHPSDRSSSGRPSYDPRSAQPGQVVEVPLYNARSGRYMGVGLHVVPGPERRTGNDRR